MLALLCSFPVRGEAQESSNTLYVGETGGYQGLFCSNKFGAEFMLKTIHDQGENRTMVLPPSCSLARATIEVIAMHESAKAADADTVWTIIEVRVPGIPDTVFVLTALTVYKGRGV